ncbi:haloacid dehalogenase-like hydrolase, partial [Acinetobacter baumannii]
VAIVTATNHFVTKPIASHFGVEHLIAALPALDDAGNLTGKLDGTPTFGPGKIVHTEAWLERLGFKLDQFERSYFYS